MEIRAQISFHSQYLPANMQKQSGQAGVSMNTESAESRPQAPEKKPNKADYAPDLKEMAQEMLSEAEKLGTFKNKKAAEETTDVKIGPDIRFALRSKNPDFLRRILWGPLTVAEYREVKYRLQEIRQEALHNTNIMSGKIISDAALKGQTEKKEVAQKTELTVDISV